MRFGGRAGKGQTRASRIENERLNQCKNLSEGKIFGLTLTPDVDDDELLLLAQRQLEPFKRRGLQMSHAFFGFDACDGGTLDSLLTGAGSGSGRAEVGR